MSIEGTNNSTFIYSGPLAARMACHMGNFSPLVLCNILGDQPLFYIDYVDEDEIDFLDAMDKLGGPALSPEFFADNLDELRRRMARLESASQHIDAYARENVEAAFDAAAGRMESAQTPLTRDALDAAIASSGLIAGLYADAAARGLTLALNPYVDDAAYDRDAVCIHVNPRLEPALAVLALARALRSAWLHVKGAAINPLNFQPEEAVLLNRIQQADLAVTAIRAAWEANLSGRKEAWARILTVSSYDLAVGFAREAIADFRALNGGQAAAAAFERWFFSGRCKDVDRRLIQQMLADNHGLVFEHPQTSKMITTDVIARTGDLPTGRNYLTGLIETMLADPLFTEVRDRSNANFMWFIKFERSFRAAENGLEEKAQKPAAGRQAGKAPTAKVIAFKGPSRKKTGAKTLRTGSTDMATVYYIDHFFTFSNR